MNQTTKLAIVVIGLVILLCIFISMLDLDSVNDQSWQSTGYEFKSIANDEEIHSSTSKEIEIPNLSSPLLTFKDHRNYKLFSSRNCGPVGSGPRITNGEKTELMANPWIVALVYYNNKSNTYSVDCAGSLISDSLVLTAAHCITKNQEPILIRLGEYDLTTNPDCLIDDFDEETCADPVQEITDFKILKHENYFKHFDDIALIKLGTPAKLYQNNIKTICLPFDYEMEMPKRFIVTGWGRMFNNETHSNILLEAKVPFISREICKLKVKATLSKGHLCAGGEDNKDSCKGDSGGPLTHLYYAGRAKTCQFGIVSFGAKNSCGTSPGVYTNVTNYLWWILDNADF